MPPRTAPRPSAPLDPAADLLTFAREEEADRRTLRRALGAAAAAHLVLLLVHLPDLGAEVAEPKPERPFYVAPTRRWEQPPPRTETRPPPRRPLRVPMPDPTPDDPEPIRMLEAEPPELEIDFGDVVEVPPAPPPPEPAGPIVIDHTVVPPVKRFAPQPPYTEAARRARIEGVVVLQAVVDEQGRVGEVRVLRGLPLGLDRSAAETLATWRFEPATRQGRPVAVYYNLSVFFAIQ
ncbi:MAG TPA: energy transducer TonB [Thermoanaerobaculia bacterium]|nr:energy transducer TonB [Thermoanaerobaculia bacterium]